jgi:phosphomethylpyrimidine synthase
MCGPKFCSMKISHDIRRDHGGDVADGSVIDVADEEIADEEIAAGMAEKSREFAAAGNRVYLPLAE